MVEIMRFYGIMLFELLCKIRKTAYSSHIDNHT